MFGEDVKLNNPAYIHSTAQIYGAVQVSEGASIWPYAVIRSEANEVLIGEKTNIQDFVMIHIGLSQGTYIGNHCSITHHCTLHGCKIGDNCLIGINTTIMDGCVVGDNCIIAGHTYLKEGTIIPDNSIVAGTPGKVVKKKNSRIENRLNAIWYYENALGYAQGNHRRLSNPEVLKEIEETVRGQK
ncbi:MAG: gamma carbonic anhydrase family protein [Cellvibrionales bacterium]|nr:MAG: gamma carbonic anhydrase family protein [Cellvibrionales bacterium]